MVGQAVKRQKQFELLLIEDDPANIRLTKEALQEASFPYRLQVAMDGMAALQTLRREVPFHQARRPDLILLDWNLPRLDGKEVLREIKQDDHLRDIPVVVLTTSTDASDIERAYDLHANCYIAKPMNVLQFFSVIRAVEQFWLSTATLPKH